MGIYCQAALTQSQNHEWPDRSFFPVYERREALGLPIFLHPMMINNGRMKQFYLINVCGNPFDTVLAASHLIYGGVLTALRGRLDSGFYTRAECKTISNPPSSYLKRFTYDTFSYNKELLEDLIKLVGADRILVGSDYCFDIAYEEPVRYLTA